MGRKQLGAAASDASDTVIKASIDYLAMMFAAQSGQLLHSPGILSASAQGSNPTSGRLFFLPFLVSKPLTIDRLYCNVTTAQVSGTDPSLHLGIYGSKANGMPDTGQLLGGGTATSAIGSTGNKYYALPANLTLQPGLYWVAQMYYASSAPSTLPRCSCNANSVWAISYGPGSFTVGQVVRGLYLTGQTALPTTTTADGSFSITGSTDAPVVAVRVV